MADINHPQILLGGISSLHRLDISRNHPWYDYDPCAMLEKGKIKIWWLGRWGQSEAISTDNVLYSESVDEGATWSKPISVLAPRVGSHFFDKEHVGNCSVIRVKGKYYMYYSAGRGDDHNDLNKVPNAVGFAESDDGIHWSRPLDVILYPNRDRVHVFDKANRYGAGTPSAIYVGGLFYLMYQDTTGCDSNANAGIYIVRARDPQFTEDAEVLTNRGWESRHDGNMTEYAILRHNAPDAMWIPELKQFMYLYHSTGLINFADADFKRLPYSINLGIENAFEGTGFLRDPHGHAISNNDGFIIDVFAGLVKNVPEGAHPAFSSDLQRVKLQAQVNPASCHLRYDQYVIQTEGEHPGITWNGKILRFLHIEVGHIPYLLSNHFQLVDRSVWDSFEVMPTIIGVAHKVIATSQQPAAFVLTEPSGGQQGQSWAVDYSGIPNFWDLCKTHVEYVSEAEYARYSPVGHSHVP